ncbi:MAG: 7TM-DISM domain-containing protein [Pedobacter sp.]|nr:7TM-DISM domain-containing protein [Pedobacter sp.]
MRLAARSFLLFLFVLLALPAWSQTVSFTRDDAGVVLNHDFALLRDASGRMDIAEVAASSQFRAAQWRDFTPGYTSDVIWLRLRFYNPLPDDGDRYLEVGPPRLQDVRLYQPLPNGGWQVLQGGTVVPVAERLVPSRMTAFPLRLLPGETRTVYVRISSGNAIMLHTRLWHPLAFHQAERRLALVNGMQYGAILLLTVYGLLLFFTTREPALVFFVLMVGAAGLNDVSLLQYAYQYLWPHSPDWNLRSPGIIGVISMAGGAWLILRLLHGGQHFPHQARLLHVFCVMMLLTIPAMLWGHYAYWATISYLLSMAVMVVIGVLTVRSALARVPDSLLVLQAFALTWVLTILRLGQLFGWLPHDILIDYSQNWAMLLTGSLIVIVIMAALRKLREEREEAERLVLDARLHAEQEVQLRTRELQLAKEMAEATSRAKSTFLAHLSHELRTPLHSILGYSGLIHTETSSTSDRRRIEAVLHSSRHLLELIDELLDYARVEAGRLSLEPRPVYLHALLESTQDEVRELAQSRGIALGLVISPAVPAVVMADAVRLRQILLNLMVNACRHSQASEVVLEVKTLVSGEAGEQLWLGVRDNGIGIPEEARERIFNPFEQGSNKAEGMGLGLAIARQFAQLMQGDLRCEPVPEGGTLFHFTMPVERASEAQLAPLAGKLRLRRYAGPVRRILIVDDIADNRALLADVLASFGFDLALADGGSSALQLLADEPFDLVITDQLMPDMSGWELLRQARAAGHAMPFILLSGAMPVLPDGWSPKLVFAVILMKPAEPSRLAEALASVLRLEWVEEEDVPEAVPSPALVRPPEPLLQALREAASQGRISDIEDWIEQVQVSHPASLDFTQAVLDAARRLDLPAILQLADS